MNFILAHQIHKPDPRHKPDQDIRRALDRFVQKMCDPHSRFHKLVNLKNLFKLLGKLPDEILPSTRGAIRSSVYSTD